jgi:hypothetical protein
VSIITNVTNVRRYRGRIVQLDAIRGFGFVQASEALPFGSDRLFIHKANSIDALFLGAWIEFEVGLPYKLGQNPQAIRVRVVEEVVVEVVEPNVEVSQIGAIKVGA